MNIDTYTKFLLTVIAASLLYLCAMQSGATLLAQPVRNVLTPLPAQPVVVVGYGHLDPRAPGGVAIAWENERAGVGDPVLPVRVVDASRGSQTHVVIDAAPQLSVSVDAVKKSARWDPIRTEVERQPPQPKPGGAGGGSRR